MFQLSCCSTVDLTRAQLAARGIACKCFSYTLGDTSCEDDPDRPVPMREFYARMAAGAQTQTSRINTSEYEEYFEPMLAAGKDVLHVSFSSGLTGSIDSARMAAAELREKYPGRKLIIVDSLAASLGYALLMDELVDLRDSGADIETAAAWVERERLSVQHLFYSTDLSFYIRGGRVSKASGFVAGLLGICPLLDMDAAGHLVPREKIRGRKKVMKRIVERMAELTEGGEAYAGRCYISHSDMEDDANALADMLRARFPQMKKEILIGEIGPIIGSHTGPGTVALFFRGKARV